MLAHLARWPGSLARGGRLRVKEAADNSGLGWGGGSWRGREGRNASIKGLLPWGVGPTWPCTLSHLGVVVELSCVDLPTPRTQGRGLAVLVPQGRSGQLTGGGIRAGLRL